MFSDGTEVRVAYELLSRINHSCCAKGFVKPLEYGHSVRNLLWCACMHAYAMHVRSEHTYTCTLCRCISQHNMITDRQCAWLQQFILQKPVLAGDELTLEYEPDKLLLMSQSSRQIYFKDVRGFLCQCELCRRSKHCCQRRLPQPNSIPAKLAAGGRAIDYYRLANLGIS